MSKKKVVFGIIAIAILVLCNIYIALYRFPLSKEKATLKVTVNADKPFTAVVYYLEDGQSVRYGYVGSQLIQVAYEDKDKRTDKTLEFSIPGDTSVVRFDAGDADGRTITVKNTEIEVGDKVISNDVFNKNDFIETQQLGYKSGSELVLKTKGTDPFISFDVNEKSIERAVTSSCQGKWMRERLVMLAAIDLVSLLFIVKRKGLLKIPKDIIKNKKLLFNLSKNDFKTRFAGSYLGIIWAFVNPVVTVLLYWFVFEKALHAAGHSTRAGISVPYVLWLISGLVPWFYFSEALSSGTNALIEYSYLVKKVVFNVSILPAVKIISSMFVHLFFLGFTVILYATYGYYPNFHTLQIFYYSFCMIVFTLSIVYFTSATVVFFRDLSQIINIFMQVVMWMTPIMWDLDSLMVSPVIKTILKLNPMFYVVNGYRDSLINNVWFWQQPGMTVYFWSVTAILFAIGSVVFRRLQVHFADVL